LVLTAQRRLLRRRKAGCHTTLSSLPPHVIVLEVSAGVSLSRLATLQKPQIVMHWKMHLQSTNKRKATNNDRLGVNIRFFQAGCHMPGHTVHHFVQGAAVVLLALSARVFQCSTLNM